MISVILIIYVLLLNFSCTTLNESEYEFTRVTKEYYQHLNITRFKRQCTNISKNWVRIEDQSNFSFKNVSNSLSGIKDCDRPLECIVLVSAHTTKNQIYILPKWRKFGLRFWVKAWNPDIYEGLIISFSSFNQTQHYILVLGDEDNEKLVLYYRNRTSEYVLLRKAFPHVISAGKWKEFWFKPTYGKVQLGFAHESVPFFEWLSFNEELSFTPAFVNFGSTKGHYIGISFQYNECITTQTSSGEENKIYPFSIWQDNIETKKLDLYLRGVGAAVVSFRWKPDFEKQLTLKILSKTPCIQIIQYKNNKTHTVTSYSVPLPMLPNQWSKYSISFSGRILILRKNNAKVLQWKSLYPLHFYWFTVSAENGVVSWTANCPPPDIDGEPRDGCWSKWGSWSCSVTCGKGIGKIQRHCSDPPPNVYGNFCEGQSLYEGPCNDFPCGTISPDISKKIRLYLSSQYKSLRVNASQKIKLPCNEMAVSAISREVHDANITWTHNGLPYSKTQFYIDENYNLVIPRTQEKHNGVYLCIVYQNPMSIPSKIILEVVSLVVIKNKTKKIRKGRCLTLKCNGLALANVYSDLSQRWELNGSLWKDYGLGSLQTFSIEKLKNVSDSYAGIWTCVIIQEDLKFKWVTNRINLKVKSAPDFWSHLMEVKVIAPIFGKLGSERNAMIVFFSLLSVVICSFLITTFFFITYIRGNTKK